MGAISETLARKRTLTSHMGEKIAKGLFLSPEEKLRLLKQINSNRIVRKRVNEDLAERELYSEYYEVSEDVFNLISEWYHYAILALIDTSDFQPQEKFIAKRLGISVIEVRAALDRMIRLGMIKKNGEKLIAKQDISSSHEIPSEALRKYHLQLLDKAKRAIEEVPLQKRDITSITMAVDVSNLPQAKKMIQRFRRRLAKFLECGNPTDVFHLNVQLFSATEGKIT